ncbi:MAG: ABC transporter permease [Bacteroidota bacterium]|nr:ABC transporter permease [Bacteroidota bacterium]
MGKIGIIIWREYMSRVKNRTFIVMCFVAPLLVGGMFYLTQELSKQIDNTRKIVVVDQSILPDSLSYAYAFHDTENIRVDFRYVHQPLSDVVKIFKDSVHTSVLVIPQNFNGADTSGMAVGLTLILKSKLDPGTDVINQLQNMISIVVQRETMQRERIPRHAVDLALKKVTVANEIIGKGVSDNDIQAYVGLGFGMIIYMYILMFGVQIMRSVVEEKMTRIVEVIISSVKPFQLMLGKIIGVTMVGLTQFLIWMILTFAVVTPVINSVHDKNTDFTRSMPQQMKTGVPLDQEQRLIAIHPTEKTEQVVNAVMSIPWGNLIPAFLLYFLFGYFLYASIFAAIGSAAEMDADTQQFTLPITIPLIIAVFSFGNVVNDPDGYVAKLLSMIPFTSPIVMLMRIPFGGVTLSELFISLGILVITFLFFTWIAGRIYRVGILMYGKKASWREIGKWIFYKA